VEHNDAVGLVDLVLADGEAVIGRQEDVGVGRHVEAVALVALGAVQVARCSFHSRANY
jgi:hypothetical protein